jgi:predicted DNA-binding protein (MmcQ/YjbR family)
VRYEAFHDMALKLPGARFDVKWGCDRTFCVGPKMFAHAGPLNAEPSGYMFKASELGFEMLTGAGLAAPAPYLGKAKWVLTAGPDALSDEELADYVAQSYRLVAAGLTAKLRRELGVEI